jgi:MFS family permease
MLDGARHLAERRGAGYVLLALGAHRVLFGLSLIATLLLYRNHFTDGTVFRTGLAGLGQVVLAGAAGALVAAAVTPWATRHTSPRRWVATLLGSAAVIQLVLGLQYTPPAVVAASFAIGLAGHSIKIVADTAIQAECDDDYRGRVFGFYDTLFNVALVVGLFVGAVTLPPTGRSVAVVLGVAAGYGVVAVTYAWAASRWHRRTGFLATGHPDTAAVARSPVS